MDAIYETPCLALGSMPSSTDELIGGTYVTFINIYLSYVHAFLLRIYFLRIV